MMSINIQLIKNIITNDWDPIDIGDNNNLSEEYNDVLREIININNRENVLNEIEKILERFEKDCGIYDEDRSRIPEISERIARALG